MITLIRDDEPFLRRERSGEELADSDLGFMSGEAGEANDGIKSLAWQREWAEAQQQVMARSAVVAFRHVIPDYHQQFEWFNPRELSKRD
jgi:hypothetical protein